MPKIIPFGDRILVKRKKVGDTHKSNIILTQEASERDTELAKILHIPEHSFCDTQLIEKAEKIVKSLTMSAETGDSEALKALLLYREYLNIKSLQVGDWVMISKYVGIQFNDSEGRQDLWLVNGTDIIGLVSNV